jgi:hypothetical protein
MPNTTEAHQPIEAKKEPKKPTIDADADYLNHQIFYFMVFAIFAANLTIWAYLGS